MDFDQFTVALLVLRADRPRLSDADENALQDAHLAYLASMHDDGHLVAAGPLRTEPDDPMAGLSIFTVDADRARELAAADPAVVAGRFEVRIMPWMVPGGAVSFSPTTFPRSIAQALGR